MWSQEEEHRQRTSPIRVVSDVRTLRDLLWANTSFLLTRSLFFFGPAGLFNGDVGFFEGDEFFFFLSFATDCGSVAFFFREVSREELFIVDWDVTARDAAFFGLHVVPASGGLFCDNLATRSDFLVPTDFDAGNEGGPLFVVWATARR